MAADLLMPFIITAHQIWDLLWSNSLRVNENILIHRHSLAYIKNLYFPNILQMHFL
jgi:hypothetical protein